jgi:hypothetical protein
MGLHGEGDDRDEERQHEQRRVSEADEAVGNL